MENLVMIKVPKSLLAFPNRSVMKYSFPQIVFFFFFGYLNNCYGDLSFNNVCVSLG